MSTTDAEIRRRAAHTNQTSDPQVQEWLQRVRRDDPAFSQLALDVLDGRARVRELTTSMDRLDQALADPDQVAQIGQNMASALTQMLDDPEVAAAFQAIGEFQRAGGAEPTDTTTS